MICSGVLTTFPSSFSSSWCGRDTCWFVFMSRLLSKYSPQHLARALCWIETSFRKLRVHSWPELFQDLLLGRELLPAITVPRSGKAQVGVELSEIPEHPRDVKAPAVTRLPVFVHVLYPQAEDLHVICGVTMSSQFKPETVVGPRAGLRARDPVERRVHGGDGFDGGHFAFVPSTPRAMRSRVRFC